MTRSICVPLDSDGPATIRHVFVTGCPVTRQLLEELPPGAVQVPSTPVHS